MKVKKKRKKKIYPLMYHNIHPKLASWSHAFDSLEFDKSKSNSIFSRSK